MEVKDYQLKQAGALINEAFNLNDRDLINGHANNCLDERVALIIQAWENKKHELQYHIEYSI